jgi:hypothetical protein
MKLPANAGIIVFLFIALLGCKKENSNGTFQVKLTDAPYNAQEVNVDIRQVVVKYARDTAQWVNLDTRAGIYNLLSLQNNVQTVLATGGNSGETVKELRLVLGAENSIKIDSLLYPLTIPSGSESGLKIKLNKKFSSRLDSLVVDFDAGLSVIKTGSNEYKLKPVLKIK